MSTRQIILPVVAETEISGVKIKVRAAKYGALRAVSKTENGDDRLVKLAELVNSSCEYASDGSPIDVDDLSLADILRLTNLALEGKADFQTPPVKSPSGGAE